MHTRWLAFYRTFMDIAVLRAAHLCVLNLHKELKLKSRSPSRGCTP